MRTAYAIMLYDEENNLKHTEIFYSLDEFNKRLDSLEPPKGWVLKTCELTRDVSIK